MIEKPQMFYDLLKLLDRMGLPYEVELDDTYCFVNIPRERRCGNNTYKNEIHFDFELCWTQEEPPQGYWEMNHLWANINYDEESQSALSSQISGEWRPILTYEDYKMGC